jgi:hypothetical protein
VTRVLPPLLLLAACASDYQVSSGPVDVNPNDVTECPFSPISGTQFSRYDCNPVFAGTVGGEREDWIAAGSGVGSVGFHAEEVLGHPFYQMWYATSLRGGGTGLGYAVSGDGVNWTPHPDNPVYESPTSGWNRDSMAAVSVVWDSTDDRYVLQYQGVNYETQGNGLGMLQSTDGISWDELNFGDPILELSEEVGGVRYCWPLSLQHAPGDGFLGYIGGTNGGASDQKCEVFGYGGEELSAIDPGRQPVLPAGPGREDQMGVASAAVVKFEDTWYMFYVGFRDWQPIPGTSFITPLDTTLNMATSSDGINWDKSPDNPFLAISNVTGPSVLGNVAAQVVGSRIHLWIDDEYASVGGSAVGYFLYEPTITPHP